MHHKNYRITIDDANDLDLVMSMYNLLVYSSNYSDTIGNLWFYSKDEATNFKLDLVDCTVSIFQSVELLGNTEADGANGILKKNNNRRASKVSK